MRGECRGGGERGDRRKGQEQDERGEERREKRWGRVRFPNPYLRDGYVFEDPIGAFL